MVVGELSTQLLVQAALDHGITRVITELVSNRYGSELYKISPPSALIVRAFIDILCELKKEHDVLCLGIQNRVDHTLTANPAADYCLGSEDELLVIAGTRPDLTTNPA